MKAIKIAAAMGLLLAASAAEAQKATGGEVPEAGASTKPSPDAAAAPEATTGTDTTAGAAPGAGALVVASDPQGVLSAMQALGYTASLGVDGANDPLITGAIDGINYNVYFYGCQDNANCQWLLFSAGFDMPNGSTMDVVNKWNQENLVGQAYLDAQQDPYVNYFVTTTGGLTQANFADAVDWWRVALGDFRTAIGF